MQLNALSARIDFCRKLGVKEGHTIVLLDAPTFVRGLARVMFPLDGVQVRTELEAGVSPDIVLFWPNEATDLPSVFGRLRATIQPDGAVWVVIPKKPLADTRGPRVYFDQMLAAALPTGLVDNKTLTFSQEEYGIRFMVRQELRKLKPWE